MLCPWQVMRKKKPTKPLKGGWAKAVKWKPSLWPSLRRKTAGRGCRASCSPGWGGLGAALVLWLLPLHRAQVTAPNSTARAWRGEAGEKGIFSSCPSRASALLWRKWTKAGTNLEIAKREVYLREFTRMDWAGFQGGLIEKHSLLINY